MSKLLIKYPSRGRPQRFFDGLDSIYSNLHDRENTFVSCTLDDDDDLMRRSGVIERILDYPNCSIAWGKSNSKIHAVNRDLPDDWDIVAVTSDDIRFCVFGFDEIIRQEMSNHFPEGDGYLHFWEKDSQAALNVMPIMDKKYFSRFGWIYHPAYSSLWVDNEQTETAKILGRYRFIHFEIFKHFNPAYGYDGFDKDEMFLEQQKIGWSTDHQLYIERKAKNFDL